MSASVFLPAPVPELLKRIKSDPNGIFEADGKDIFVGRSPGRLDVMGGIADYTGSLVCEMPLDVAAAVAVQRRDDRKLVLRTYNLEAAPGGATPATVELSLDDFYGTAALLPYETLQRLFTGATHWASYVAGAFPVLAKYKKLTRRVTGANIACYSTVPLGGRLSSSAALECAALTAFTTAYHLILDPMDIAVLAQKLENHIVGAPCGVKDQITSVLGKKDQLLLIHCQPHEIQGYVPIPAGTIIAGINSNVKHSVARTGYQDTRNSAFIAHAIIARMHKDLIAKPNAKDPTNGYLANITPENYQRYFRLILPENITGEAFLRDYGQTIDRPTTIDPSVNYYPRAAADHHVLENARVRQFVQYLQTAATDKSAAEKAGALMLESHKSYSDNARLGCPETDLLVDLIMQRGPKNGFYGAKITGRGTGGTVAVFAENSDRVRQGLQDIATDYQKQTQKTPQLFLSSSPGSAELGAIKLTLQEVGIAKS